MANIGTFTADKDGFTGTIRTLTPNVKVKLIPNEKESENAPDFRVQAAGGYGIGAAWKKVTLRVSDPRRSHVPDDDLCPPD